LFFTGSSLTLVFFLVFSGEDMGDDEAAALFAADLVFVLLIGDTVVEVLPSSVISRWKLAFACFEEGGSESASLSSERAMVDRRCRLAGRGAISKHGWCGLA
jgi:hypothetical protein